MSTSELKQKLINRIQKSDIEDYKLSESQKREIEEARAGIKTGKFISNEESNSQADEWLKE